MNLIENGVIRTQSVQFEMSNDNRSTFLEYAVYCVNSLQQIFTKVFILARIYFTKAECI